MIEWKKYDPDIGFTWWDEKGYVIWGVTHYTEITD